MDFGHSGLMGRLIAAPVYVQLVLSEVFLCTEHNSCPVRDVELDIVPSVLPGLSDVREEDVLGGGQSVKPAEVPVI